MVFSDTVPLKPRVLPYEEAWFLSRWIFHWAEPIITACHRGTLTVATLYLCPAWLSARENGRLFSQLWVSKEKNRSKDWRFVGRKGWLWMALLFGGLGLLWSGILELTVILLLRQGSVALKRFIALHGSKEFSSTMKGLVDSQGGTRITLQSRFGSLGLLLGIQFARKLIQNKSLEIISALAFTFRAGIMTTVYEQILESKLVVLIGSSLNRLAIDSNRISTLLLFGHLAWSGPLRIVMAFYAAHKAIGVAALAGIAFVLLILLGLFVLIALMPVARRRVAALSDERLQLTSEVLCSVRTVKALACEDSLLDRIFDIRDRELQSIGRLNMLFSATAALNFWAPVFATTLTVVFATLKRLHLDASSIYTASGAFQSLTAPLWLMPSLISRLIAASVSAGRIDQVLRAASSIGVAHDVQEGLTSQDQGPLLLILDDASFADDCETIVLDRLNLRIVGPSLVAISGPMSSGKTALVSSLAHILHLQSAGSYCHPTSIGYCPFPGWLHSGSVQENILFGRPLDASWYLAVFKACMLYGELEDAQSVGESGCLLSGGQRQRVALARAIYGKPALLLVDDILSSLDEAVAEALFENVFSPRGLMGSAIRFIVTNDGSLMAGCDRVVRMQCIHTVPTIASVEDVVASRVSAVAPRASMGAIDEPAVGSHDLEDEKCADSKMRLFWILVEAIGGVFPLCLLFAVTSGTDISRLARDEVLKQHLKNPKGSTQSFLAYFITFSCLQGLFSLGANIYAVVLCLRASRRIHNQSLRRIVTARMNVLSGIPSGRLLNRLGRDLETLDYSFPEKLICMMGSTSSLLCMTLTVARTVPYLFYSVFLPVFLFVLLQHRFAVAWRTILRLTSQSMGPLTAILSESLAGLATIRVFQKRGLFLSRLQVHIDRYTLSSFLSVGIRRWASLRCELVATLYLSILGIYSILVGLDAVSAGDLFSKALGAAESMDWLIKHLAEIDHSLISVERIAVFSQQLPGDAKASSSEHPASLPPCPVQNLHFRKVVIKYSEETVAAEPIVTIDELCIPQGMKVAILGRTGAGKSSLLSAILGFCPYDGLITLDQTDVRLIPQLRGHLVVSVLQETTLFEATVRDNLLVGYTGPVDDLRLWSILDLVEMRSFISTLPLGLDAPLKTQALSAGQRQLICIGRALLRFPSAAQVLLLDEATANLEPGLEITIHQRILQWVGPNVMVLAVTHRSDVANLYERQILLQDRTILESSLMHQQVELR